MILTLRPEQPDDIPVIREIVKAAFRNVSHSDQKEHMIVDLLRQEGALEISRVAELDGRLVAHAAISKVRISNGADQWFGLGPVAVLPSEQNKGLGKKLIASTLSILEEQGAQGCVVLGEPGYYQKFGFTPHCGLVLQGVPDGYFMLRSFTSQVPQGEVTYHLAFQV